MTRVETGSLARSDRITKYNQLPRIDGELGEQARYAGEAVLTRWARARIPPSVTVGDFPPPYYRTAREQLALDGDWSQILTIGTLIGGRDGPDHDTCAARPPTGGRPAR